MPNRASAISIIGERTTGPFSEFSELCKKAFHKLKEAVLAPPMLSLPENDLPYSVDTDACDYQIFAACSAIPVLGRGVKGSEKRKCFGCCGPGWKTHVCDAAHDYFNYFILFTN